MTREVPGRGSSRRRWLASATLLVAAAALTTAAFLTGGPLTGGSLTGGSLTGESLTGGSLTGESQTGESQTGGSPTGETVTTGPGDRPDLSAAGSPSTPAPGAPTTGRSVGGAGAAPVAPAPPDLDVPGPAPAPGRARTPVSSRPERERPERRRSVPIRIRIPDIGLAVGLTELGLRPDRTVEVPTDFAAPGWFGPGPAPGQVGSAVILGHVDSFRGPAVFFRLRSLRPGNEVQVDLADGSVARFAVREVMTYPKERFPARQVYGSNGTAALQLVTCGGEFDTRTRSYRSNVVVFTTLIEVVPAR